MQIKVIAESASKQNQISVLSSKPGQSAPKFAVQPGQKLTIEINGEILTKDAKKTQPQSARYKLVKHENDLWVQSADGQEQLLELTGFYESSDVVLVGDHWAWAAETPLQQQDGGVVALFANEAVASTVVATEAVLASSGAVATAAFGALGPVGVVAGGLVAVAAGQGSGGQFASPQDAALAAISAIAIG